MKIPICIKPKEFEDCAYELHVFGDACEVAYGTCACLRCVDCSGVINTALLFTKHRVSPIKTISLPRLELQSAVLVAKIADYLSSELSIPITAHNDVVQSL